MCGVKVKTRTQEEDPWGYFEGERVWLKPPHERPFEEYIVTDGPPEKCGTRANDNMQVVKFN